MSRLPVIQRRAPSRTLLGVTAAITALGIGLLAWATAMLPLDGAIRLDAPELAGSDPIAAGLVFWIVLGLSGSLRVSGIDGHAVLTFHLPFIVAAMLLGGPVAGGWVAFVSTLEAREFREVPWYGTLANHATQAGAAVLGGLAATASIRVAAAWVSPEAAILGGAVVGASVFGAISVAAAAVTIALREHLTARETALIFTGSWRRTMLAECIVAWVLAFVYGSIGWWAPVVCVALVLLVWESHDDREQVAHDEMTGLLNRHGLMLRLGAAVSRVRRSGMASLLIMLDLDGFKQINDTYGHAVGDEVLQIVSERLRGSIRVTDSAARMGGDEFVLLIPGVEDAEAAAGLADRIHARLAEPIAMGEIEVRVGSSLGLVLVDGRPFVTLLRLLAEADRAMYAAKRAGGGIRFGWGEAATSTATA